MMVVLVHSYLDQPTDDEIDCYLAIAPAEPAPVAFEGHNEVSRVKV